MHSLNCFLQYFPQYFQTAKSNRPTKASYRNSLDSVIMLRPIKVALHSKRKLTKNNNKRGEEKHRQIIFYKNYTFHTQNYSDHSFRNSCHILSSTTKLQSILLNQDVLSPYLFWCAGRPFSKNSFISQRRKGRTSIQFFTALICNHIQCPSFVFLGPLFFSGVSTVILDLAVVTNRRIPKR